MWATARIIEQDWEITGQETLGISGVDDPESPLHGLIPIIPIIDTQMDQIIIQETLRPLRATLIARLDKMIRAADPAQWFEIYLTVFILLSHFEMAAKHCNNFAREVGKPVAFPILYLFPSRLSPI